MRLRYVALPTDEIRALQAGGPDANGQMPERQISDGDGNPCRHCLKDIPEGAEMLVLSYRPFPEAQPYAEQGPIFLCAEACARADESPAQPEIFRETPRILVRGYGADNRIRYGTGTVVPMEAAETAMENILKDDDVAYVHMRSASNNCFQVRVERD